MLIGEKFIYFELQKTGGTYTRRILSELPTVNSRSHGHHNTYTDLPLTLMKTFDSKIKVGNIRNPWDWYVSLWAFGCMGRGNLYNKVTQKHNRKMTVDKKETTATSRFKNVHLWESVYADANSPELFRAWLKLMIDRPKVHIGERYKISPISDSAGFLTYRYLKMYNYNTEGQIAGLRNFQKIQQFDIENNFIDIIIRIEHIIKDLLDNAPKLGVSTQVLQKILEKYSDKTNTSIRQPYPFYYDDETKNLVAKKERLIIKKYGYEYNN